MSGQFYCPRDQSVSVADFSLTIFRQELRNEYQSKVYAKKKIDFSEKNIFSLLFFSVDFCYLLKYFDLKK